LWIDCVPIVKVPPPGSSNCRTLTSELDGAPRVELDSAPPVELDSAPPVELDIDAADEFEEFIASVATSPCTTLLETVRSKTPVEICRTLRKVMRSGIMTITLSVIVDPFS
jgi:hypothetical protein